MIFAQIIDLAVKQSTISMILDLAEPSAVGLEPAPLSDGLGRVSHAVTGPASGCE